MVQTTNNTVRVRFAPSPTGHLHIGGVRTALFNWLFARHHGGTYLLRVEDTDLQRSTKEFLSSQLQSLAWMNLLPDEEPVFQMQRAAEHKKAAMELMEKGLAYPCFCEPRDAQQVVQELEHGIINKYPGTCRGNEWRKEDLEKPYCIRFKLPEYCQEVVFQDVIRGSIRVTNEHLDDMVIMRRDGSATYNFCVVIDDIAMNITHVIRGEDHLTNTAKQILFYQALNATQPVFAHLPLILGKSGQKLSKRDAAVSVEQYREAGFMADALANYLVRLGWAHGDQEIFSRQELIELFSIENVGKKGSIFDMQKLEWLNGLYIRQADFPTLMQAIGHMDQAMPAKLRNIWPDQAILENLIEQYKQRATTLKSLCVQLISFAQQPHELDMEVLAQWYTSKTPSMLQEFSTWFAQQKNIEKETALQAAKEITAAHDEKLVGLAQPLRLALTGSLQSPSVFDLITLLGKDKTLQRINALLEKM